MFLTSRVIPVPQASPTCPQHFVVPLLAPLIVELSCSCALVGLRRVHAVTTDPCSRQGQLLRKTCSGRLAGLRAASVAAFDRA